MSGEGAGIRRNGIRLTLWIAAVLALAPQPAGAAPPLPRERPASAAPDAGAEIALPRSRPPAGGSPAIRTAPDEPEAAPRRTANLQRGTQPEEQGDALPALPLARPEPPAAPEEPGPLELEAEPVDMAELRACEDRLRRLGVTFREAGPVESTCRLAAPLEVSALAPGVALRPEALMTCRAAEALARWTRQAVIPAAKEEMDTRLTGLDHASAFVCRTRYNRPGSKVSEHARANAVDIAAFRLGDGSRLAVQPPSDHPLPERRFQMRVRKAACDYFTTVLGPGSNAAHETHFHLDMAQRRGGYRVCELSPPTDESTASAAGRASPED